MSSADHERTLILLPDGSGSASSYANLPRISEDTCVIAINCPFLRDPQKMIESNMETIMDLYLEEIRACQPKGPYRLGGWSVGGVLAYLAAQRLVQEHEVVDTLVLIDSPMPNEVDELLPRFYDHLKIHNVFGRILGPDPSASRPMPEWLIPHFQASIKILSEYVATNDVRPVVGVHTVCVIWAPESVIDGVNIPKLGYRSTDTEGMKFLVERRVDFSPGSWAKLFPGAELHSRKIEGANHFSMMVSIPPFTPSVGFSANSI
ncbi:Alpha/Beta hydrolase protein [Nemania abortiva]|nr:Alpha/Beta hydrolase protein [Nemania abortiva]